MNTTIRRMIEYLLGKLADDKRFVKNVCGRQVYTSLQGSDPRRTILRRESSKMRPFVPKGIFGSPKKWNSKPELYLKRRAVLFFLPCQENSNDCSYKDNRCYPDKQPFKCMKSHSHNGGFRVTVIPAQIRTA